MQTNFIPNHFLFFTLQIYNILKKIPSLCFDSAHLNSNFAKTDNRSVMKGIVTMRDVRFDKSLFVNYMTGIVLDQLLCSYQGLPKGVNYMIIGDPGVGKTTIILDMIANIQLSHLDIHILFISAEMNEIDLAIYVQRYPKFADLNIMFVEADFNTDAHCLRDVEETLRRGWDIIAIDSFYELQGIVKEEENLTLKKAESQLLSLIKKQNKAENDRGVHTTFLTIQQVTKSGAFIGSNRLKLLQRKRDIRPYYDIFTE